jgi:hypothetical protein
MDIFPPGIFNKICSYYQYLPENLTIQIKNFKFSLLNLNYPTLIDIEHAHNLFCNITYRPFNITNNINNNINYLHNKLQKIRQPRLQKIRQPRLQKIRQQRLQKIRQ